MMLVMSAIVALMFVSCHAYIGHLFSSDDEVLKLTSKLAIILSIAYVLLAVTFACFATFQGQGRPIIAALSMFFGLWGVSVPLAWTFGFKLDWGLIGVWWGLVVGYSTMTLVMVCFAVTSKWGLLSEEAIARAERSGSIVMERVSDCEEEGEENRK